MASNFCLSRSGSCVATTANYFERQNRRPPQACDEFLTQVFTQVLRRHLIFQVLTKPVSNLGGVFMSVNGDRVLQRGVEHF